MSKLTNFGRRRGRRGLHSGQRNSAAWRTRLKLDHRQFLALLDRGRLSLRLSQQKAGSNECEQQVYTFASYCLHPNRRRDGTQTLPKHLNLFAAPQDQIW